MPSIIKDSYSPKWLSITGESLTIDPILKPKPTAGVQVMFRFAFSDDDESRRIVARCSVWDHWDAEPRPIDIDDFNNLEDLTDLKEDIDGEIPPELFEGLPKSSPVELSLAFLAGVQLGHEDEVRDFELMFLNKALKAFLKSHTVTASIGPVDDGDGISIEVDFERSGTSMFSFEFDVSRKAADELFVFDKVKCIA